MDVRELPPAETALAYEAMRELRPGIGTSAEFVALVNEIQRPDGYRLAGSFEAAASGSAVAVAGFRVHHNLARGRHVYVDDFVTAARGRNQGHATALLRWLVELAADLACAGLHLDSGIQRAEAHGFYLARGLEITAFHFAARVEDLAGRRSTTDVRGSRRPQEVQR